MVLCGGQKYIFDKQIYSTILFTNDSDSDIDDDDGSNESCAVVYDEEQSLLQFGNKSNKYWRFFCFLQSNVHQIDHTVKKIQRSL